MFYKAPDTENMMKVLLAGFASDVYQSLPMALDQSAAVIFSIALLVSSKIDA